MLVKRERRTLKDAQTVGKELYQKKIRVTKEQEDFIDYLIRKEGLTMTRLFLNGLYDKYDKDFKEYMELKKKEESKEK